MFFDNKNKPDKREYLNNLKKSRNERQLSRDLSKQCVKIQAQIRGFLSRLHFISKLSAEIDKKLNDINKLCDVLAAKGVKLVPPPDICMDISRKLFILSTLKYPKKEQLAISLIPINVDSDGSMWRSRTYRYLKFILLPSLCERSVFNKNMLSLLGSNAMIGDGKRSYCHWMHSKLIHLCVSAIINQSNLNAKIAKCCSGSSAAGVVDEVAFSSMGYECLCLLLGLSFTADNAVPVEGEYSTVCAFMRKVAVSEFGLFEFSRACLLRIVDPMVGVMSEEDVNYVRLSVMRTSKVCVDRLLWVLMGLVSKTCSSTSLFDLQFHADVPVDSAVSIASTLPLLPVFIGYILTIPLITALMSDAATDLGDLVAQSPFFATPLLEYVLYQWDIANQFLICATCSPLLMSYHEPVRVRGTHTHDGDTMVSYYGICLDVDSSTCVCETPLDKNSRKLYEMYRKGCTTYHLVAGHWYLGNILTMLPYLGLTIQCTYRMMSASELCAYMDTCNQLLSAFYIEGILQAKAGVRWSTQNAKSSTLSACGVPIMYKEQLMLIYDPSFHHKLINRIIVCSTALTSSPLNNKTPKRDEAIRAEIEESLLSDSLAMSKQLLIQEELNLGGWGGLRLGGHSLGGLVTSSSKWAKKVGNSITSSIGSLFRMKGEEGFAASRATSSNIPVTVPHTSVSKAFSCDYDVDTNLMHVLFTTWGLLLPHAASSPVHSAGWKLISVLSFTTFEGFNGNDSLVHQLWLLLSRYDLSYVMNSCNQSSVVEIRCSNRVITKYAIPCKLTTTDMEFSSKGCRMTSVDHASNTSICSDSADVSNLIHIMASILKVSLIALNEDDLYETEKPMSLLETYKFIQLLNGLVFRTLQADPELFQSTRSSDASKGKTKTSSSCLQIEQRGHSMSTAAQNLIRLSTSAMLTVLRDLHTRWARRSFSKASLWEVEDSSDYYSDMKNRLGFGECLLGYMPWMINFKDRMKLVREWLDEERVSIQGDAGMNNSVFYGSSTEATRSRGITIRIRHSNLVADGIAAMNKIANTTCKRSGASSTVNGIKDRIYVKYVNEFAQEEMGIDMGGLFKDFWTEFSSRMFHPNYGLFTTTNTSDRLLYPNPNAYSILIMSGSCQSATEVDELYSFVGRILGKAIYENITVDPQFTHFFLSYINGKYNFFNIIDDLKTLDAELYKNLMFLKTYEGDVSDLALTFSVSDHELGVQTEVDLIPNGRHIEVNSLNRHRYIQAVAKYYLHDRVQKQAGAFFHGLYQVVPADMLSIFCAPELQILTSGTMSGVSVSDLQANCRYAGGYVGFGDTQINRFWKVLNEFTDGELSLLVKFVTSCGRPPSLGFKALQPPFTIQRVDCNDDSRLPSASTCFNILKLPTYSSKTIMKEKLLFAIKSNSGFDLS